MNIERPTSNVECEKMKKQTYDLEERLLEYFEERSDIIIRRSTLDVRCWTFIF